MKKNLRKAVSLLLCLLMLGGVMPLATLGVSTEYEPYEKGDIIELGSYPQSEITDISGLTENVDYVTKNSSYYAIEPIEWIVLDASSGLCISKYVLDAMRFDDKSYRYDDSEIKAWLTGDFYESAFNDAEKTATKSTAFLLSYNEAQNSSYFADNDARDCDNTAYAQAAGAQVSWWLMSEHNMFPDEGLCVERGTVGSVLDGPKVYTIAGVRPALYINLNPEITLNANGGTGEPITQKVQILKPFNPECPFTNGVLSFIGWYKDANCTQPWTDTDKVSNTMTLYAKWAAECTVTFDVQGHGTAPEAQTVYDGECVEVPAPAPTADGYIFGGWFKDKSCIYAWDFENDIITKSRTLYAKWTEIHKFTITFDVKGHGTAPEAQIVVDGDKVQKPAPTADGYTFGGWFKDESCIYAWDFDNDTVTKSMTLYAKWTEIHKFTFTFDVKGHGTAPKAQIVVDGDKVQKPADPTANGYVFGGWFKDESCIYAWDFDNDTVTGATTLYAKWTPVKLIIKNYQATLDNVDYKSNLVFNIDGNVPAGCTVKWSTGTASNDGKTTTISSVTNSEYKVSCWLENNGQKVEGTESDTVTVTVNTGFFAKIIAFFRVLLKSLPTYTDFKK